MNLEHLCGNVREIAAEAAGFIRAESLLFDASHIIHKGTNDLVSYVDQTAEKMLVEALSKLTPEAGFLVEENTVTKKGKRYNWVIDPLDGTTNFIHGIPVYAVSIALIDGEEVVLGVVYEINLCECFYAWKESPAYMNDKVIHVSGNKTLSASLIATGFPYTMFDRIDDYFKVLKALMERTHGIRRIGSAAVDLAYVACGRFDGFFEYNLNAWDVAAGAFIVSRAGGEVRDFSGTDNYIFGREIIAANALITDELSAVISEHFMHGQR